MAPMAEILRLEEEIADAQSLSDAVTSAVRKEDFDAAMTASDSPQCQVHCGHQKSETHTSPAPLNEDTAMENESTLLYTHTNTKSHDKLLCTESPLHREPVPSRNVSQDAAEGVEAPVTRSKSKSSTPSLIPDTPPMLDSPLMFDDIADSELNSMMEGIESAAMLNAQPGLSEGCGGGDDGTIDDGDGSSLAAPQADVMEEEVRPEALARSPVEVGGAGKNLARPRTRSHLRLSSHMGHQAMAASDVSILENTPEASAIDSKGANLLCCDPPGGGCIDIYCIHYWEQRLVIDKVDLLT